MAERVRPTPVAEARVAQVVALVAEARVVLLAAGMAAPAAEARVTAADQAAETQVMGTQAAEAEMTEAEMTEAEMTEAETTEARMKARLNAISQD